MTRYRVRVNVWVAVEASNAKEAKGVAEQGVRSAVHGVMLSDRYRHPAIFARDWRRFGFQAVGTPEKVDDDE